jgi:hypothetical protein
MIHVHPINDIDDHDISDMGNTCKCNPKVIIEPNADIIVVHNSFDGREGLEYVQQILDQLNK